MLFVFNNEEKRKKKKQNKTNDKNNLFSYKLVKLVSVFIFIIKVR